MWFKRKPRNRRLGREHVLDVKLRSSKVRAARTRTVALVFGGVIGSAIGLFVLFRTGEWALNQLVYANPTFALRQLEVQTDGAVSLEQLRRWTGVKLGQNLLALDLARVKRNLEIVPMIQTASIERVLPHTLRIRVTEREPLAQLKLLWPRATNGVELATLQLDADGYVLLPLEPKQRANPSSAPEDLPVISGVSAGDAKPGRRIDSPQVQAALQWLLVFEGSPMAGLADIQRIDVSAPEVLTVTTGQGAEVTFGLTDFDQQLRRWHAIFKSGQEQGKAIAKLDLAVANNIPLSWLDGPAPAVTPKPPRTLPNRKKHV